MYRLTSLKGNSQKLDGGAMFGHVPKIVWSKWIEPDDKNRIQLPCRALLIQENNKNVLIETGIGAFFDPTLKDRYGVEEKNHILLSSLNTLGLSDEDIDIVILSHLHFDHAGGLFSEWLPDKECKLLFPNAYYIVSNDGWNRACNPHPRDRASFIPQLNKLLQESGRLIILNEEKCSLLGNNYRFIFTNGHTPGLMHTIFSSPNDDKSIIFVSDLIPGLHWIHLPISMGYDRFPEILIGEKKEILELAVKKNSLLFYTHDPKYAVSRIIQEENGKFFPTDEIEEFNQLEF